MRSYPYQTPLSQLGYAAQQLKMAETLAGECGDDVDRVQPPSRNQIENPYSRQLYRHLIATVSLVVITVLGWLSLVGIAPSANAHTVAHPKSSEHSISATASSWREK
jgi:hypothetical protein